VVAACAIGGLANAGMMPHRVLGAPAKSRPRRSSSAKPSTAAFLIAGSTS
jgi:hypothetical protein